MTNPQDQRRMPNFAPVSSANSGGLRQASGYFILSGVLTIVFLCALVIAVFFRTEVSAAVMKYPVRFFLGVAMQVVAGAGRIWTGVLLNRRSRLGGILAVIFLALPLVSAAASVSISTSTLVFCVIGLIVVASVWNELR
jgi:hypothetical protein